MARTTRSISPAQAARNARAFDLSGGRFTTWYQYRKAMERGEVPALRPERIKRKSVREAQQKRRTGEGWYSRKEFVPKKPKVVKTKLPKNAPLNNAAFTRRLRRLGITREQECRDWSAANAWAAPFSFEVDPVQYRKRPTSKKYKSHSQETAANKRAWIKRNGWDAYVRVYYNAFVEAPRGADNRRLIEGSEWIEIWFVEVVKLQSSDEYESRYGVN